MAVVTASGGLTNVEAGRRLARYGPNEAPQPPAVPWWRYALRQLRDPLSLVLLGALLLTLVSRDWPEAVVIAVVIAVNTSVGTIQEARAARAVAALADLTVPEVRVVRDGREQQMPATDLVPGDLLVLSEGDVVPADAAVREAVALDVDESAMTGESVAVTKTVAPSHAQAAGPAGHVLAGTVVVHGRALVEVTATGARSALGRLAAGLAGPPPATPLQRRLARLSAQIALTAGVACVVVLAAGLLARQPLELMVLTAVSLAVAAVPEALPAVVTVSLGLASWRMARRNAIVRRLPAVEALGSVTLLATDKTGTITEGSMRVAAFDTVGAATPDELVEALALCTDARHQLDGSVAGDPTEMALLTEAARRGHTREAAEARAPRIHEIPFDSIRKAMTTVHLAAGGDGSAGVGWHAVIKGAAESVLPLVDEATADQAARTVDAWAADGLRVIAVAAGPGGGPPPLGQPAETLSALVRWRLLGLVGLADPVRAGSADTIARCRAAGIRVVMITGDHPATAAAIGRQVGLLDGDGARDPGVRAEVVDLSGHEDPAADGRALHASVLARARPEHKAALVAAWQRAGHIVAMTGDGVNDGPALRRADVGVAMGGRGTEVARQAASLVLADDDIATVVDAVEEGRRVDDNIRRFLLYGLSGGGAELLVMLLGPLFGLALPLLPAQILWVNLLTHALAGTALGNEPAAYDVLRRAPRPPERAVLGDGLLVRVVGLAVVIAGVSLVAGLLAPEGVDARSVILATIGAMQLGVAMGVRSPAAGLRSNPALPLSVLLAAGLLLAAVTVAPLQELLRTESIGWWGAAVAVACGVGATVVARVAWRR